MSDDDKPTLADEPNNLCGYVSDGLPCDEGLLRHFGQALDLVQQSMGVQSMPGRDEFETTAKERDARENAETEAHDREEAQARVIVTLDDARRRIDDLEEELTICRSRLIRTADGLNNIHWAIWQTIRRHKESSHE